MSSQLTQHHLQDNEETRLTVSSYDQASGMIVALLILVGFFFALLFLIWLTTRESYNYVGSDIVYVEEPAGRGDHAEGYERDMEEPGLEELPEIEQPQLEMTLEAVTDVVSTQLASLDSLQTNATTSGYGKGLGDSRKSGAGGEGDMDIIPRWERWQIRYSTSSLSKYAKQLDYFKIELAAAGGTPKVDYARNLSTNPITRQGTSKEEQRLYMTWRSGKLQQYDRALLTKAKIRVKGRIVMQFYPKPTENQLAEIERKNAPGKSPEEFQKTVFGVRQKGNAYEFYVMEQLFRRKPK